MSAHYLLIKIACDYCNDGYFYHGTYKDDARRAAREAGWHNEASLDMCRGCWHAGVRWNDPAQVDAETRTNVALRRGERPF